MKQTLAIGFLMVFLAGCSHERDIDALSEVISETTLTDLQFEKLENEFLFATYESPRRAKPWHEKCLRILEIVAEFEEKMAQENMSQELIMQQFLESKSALDSVYIIENIDAPLKKWTYNFSISEEGVSKEVLPIYLTAKLRSHALIQLDQMADHIRLIVFNEGYGVKTRYAQDAEGWHIIDLYSSSVYSPKRIIQVDSIYRNGTLEQFQYEIIEDVLGQINFEKLPKGSYKLHGKVYYQDGKVSFDTAVYHSAFEVK
jgi:hypothetical protein